MLLVYSITMFSLTNPLLLLFLIKVPLISKFLFQDIKEGFSKKLYVYKKNVSNAFSWHINEYMFAFSVYIFVTLYCPHTIQDWVVCNQNILWLFYVGKYFTENKWESQWIIRILRKLSQTKKNEYKEATQPELLTKPCQWMSITKILFLLLQQLNHLAQCTPSPPLS